MIGCADDDAGKERAQRIGKTEQFRRGEGHAESDRHDREGEQLARSGPHRLRQQPGQHARADDEHDGDEGDQFAENQRQGSQHIRIARRCMSTQHRRERRQRDQDDHGQQIL